MSFFHGVETIDVPAGAASVTVIASAIIALTGIAPKGTANTLTLIKNETDAAAFGSKILGFDIPQALANIFLQGLATFVVVNVFDGNTSSHTTTVTSEVVTINNRIAPMAYAPVGAGSTITAEAVTIASRLAQTKHYIFNSTLAVVKDSTDSINYSAVVDYTIDNTGLLTILNAALTDSTVLHVTYKALLVLKNTAGSATYAVKTDYTVDDYGNLTILNDALTDGTSLKVTYQKLNAGHFDGTAIVGAVGGDNVKTGMKCFLDCYNTFGIKPKILISPGYTTLSAVYTQMFSDATKYRAFACIDAPAATELADAISNRLTSSSFFTTNKRVILCYPQVTVAYSSVDGNPEVPLLNQTNKQVPYSQFVAGVISAVDNTEGYWISPSNHPIVGIIGLETPISWSISDPSTDANALNAAGIVTIAAGNDFRVWGNRSAAYPTITTVDQFICVQRTADVINESNEFAQRPYIDRPISVADIDVILETVNGFFRTLKGRGALIDGTCTFRAADNTVSELAAGHIVLYNDMLPPIPMERLTFLSKLNASLLNQILPTT